MNRLFVRAWRASLLCLALVASTVEAGPPTPLTLRDAIDAALAGNPELHAFAFDFVAQGARVEQARLSPAPELSLDIENALGTGEFRGADSAEFTFALSQVIELGGKRDARVAAAQAGHGALDIERQSRQLDVLAEVTRRYIVVARVQEQRALARRALSLAEQTVSGAERRVNAAKSPHAELDRARIALDRSKLDERRVVSELDSARKQLAATWGASQPIIDGRVVGEVQADLFALPVPGDFDALFKRLDAAPDFLRFASQTRLRDAELRLAATQRRPDLSLSAGLRRLQAGHDEALVASVSLPLFAGKRAESFVAEAQANRDRIDADQGSARVKAEATLYELHHELSRTVSEVDVLRRDIVPRTQEALKETEYAYERGRYSYLELVDAQREYLDLQAILIDTAAKAQTLFVEIERLTGAPLVVSP